TAVTATFGFNLLPTIPSNLGNLAGPVTLGSAAIRAVLFLETTLVPALSSDISKLSGLYPGFTAAPGNFAFSFLPTTLSSLGNAVGPTTLGSAVIETVLFLDTSLLAASSTDISKLSGLCPGFTAVPDTFAFS